MTRATLLHVLDHTTALGPAEVRELEQLAQAFPYCQTAHLLLAKAAHDQGTMLAGQRLRRAATYAADRTLLRRLIEQVEPARAEQSVIAEEPTVPETAPPAPEAASAAGEMAVAAALMIVEAPMAVVPEPAAAVEITPTETAISIATAPAPFIEATVSPEAAPLDLVLEEKPVAPAPEAIAEQPISLPAAVTSVLVDQEGTTIAKVEAAQEVPPLAVPEPDIELELPVQAPAIRPPVEVGEARFEFGLAEPLPPAVPTNYKLPGLVDEWAAAAVTLSMGSPTAPVSPPPAGNLVAPAAPIFTPAAFTGDAALGYGFGESSRLGFSMQLLNLLEANAKNTETVSAQTAAAQAPTAVLPPTGTFFDPDPLLMNHWATHRPAAPTLPSSLDLINNFLRRQPRLTRPAMLPPTPSAQADLSVRSTRAEPDLASESLARILVRQGKTGRAIEIYEKLMVKQPEKMAYFAAQIQQLQPPA